MVYRSGSSHAGAPCGWPGSTGNMISLQIPVNPASTALMMTAESDRPNLRPHTLRNSQAQIRERNINPGFREAAAPSEPADDDKANAPELVRHELRRPSPRQSD